MVSYLSSSIFYHLHAFTQLVTQDTNVAYPLLVIRLLPSGLAGLVVAAMLAALMSSFASLFNSCSTIFMNDIYKQFRPGSSEKVSGFF